MNRLDENDCFRRFLETRDPHLLAQVFDATAPELVRIAGYLSKGDRELTQDALQATFLTVIEDADRYDPTRALRPWLLGILANHVRKERRRSLQARGGDLAALQAGTDSPAAAAQDAEFGAAVAAAMRQLPSPFREAIVLHLQHGLTAAEIGAALGRPAGTVRTQIVRGMERLRGLLPVGFAAGGVGVLLSPGGLLAAVRRDVLATLPVPTATGSSPLALSGWRFYTMIAAGVTVLLSVIVPWLWSGDATSPASEVVATNTAVREDRGSAVVADKRELVADNAVPYLADATALTVPQGPAEDSVSVTFEVVYQDGVAAADVPLGVRMDGCLQRWRTDAAGKVVIELPWPGLHEIYVLGTNARTMLSWPSFTRKPAALEQRIEIERGTTLDVHVVDAGGEPVAGAVVEASHGFQPGQMLTELGCTDANGRFVRRDVGASGRVRVWAAGFVPSAVVNAKGEVGGTTEVQLTLSQAGLSARGMVRDEDGRPIGGARLALVQLTALPTQPQFFAADDHGSFAIDTLHAGRHALVGLHAAGELRRGQLRFEHDGHTVPELELRLTKGARIEGQLNDAQGNPVAGANVTARDRPEAIHSLPFLETFTRSAADGSFVFTAMVAGRYQLECDGAPSYELAVREGETVRCNMARQPQLSISARLLDHQGQPLARWRVALIPPGQDWPSLYSLTDEDGCIRHPDSMPRQNAGSFCRFGLYRPLGTNENEWHDFAHWPNMITPPLMVGMQHEIRIPLHARSMHAVVGHVVDAAGDPVAAAEVVMQGAFGQPFRQGARVEASTGGFRFADVPPGRYQAFVTMKGRPNLRLPVLDVRDGGERSFGRIVVPEMATVTARAEAGSHTDGDTDGLRLQLVDAEGATWRLRAQADGVWRSARLYRGTYELSGWSRGSRVVEQVVIVDREQVEIAFALEPHVATRVIVQLPSDVPRNASAWQGTLTDTLADRGSVEHELQRLFCGVFEPRMEYLLSLRPGRHRLRLRSWNGRIGEATIDVAERGGGQVTIDVQ